MKTLKTLIKISKRNLDEKRRMMVLEETRKEQLILALSLLEKEIEEEKKKAGEDIEASYTYQNYINQAIFRKATLINAIKQKEAEIQIISDEIIEIFGEVKRYEIIQDIKNKEREKIEAKREQDFLDEISIQNFIRSEKI